MGQPNILLQLIQTCPSDKNLSVKPSLSISQICHSVKNSCSAKVVSYQSQHLSSHAISLLVPNLAFHKEQSDLTSKIQQQGIAWMILVVNTNESVKTDHSRKFVCKQNHGFRNLSINIETNIVFLSNFQSIKQFLYCFITQRIYVADN